MSARRAGGTKPPADPTSLPIDSSVFFKLVRVVNLTARPFVETLSRKHRISLNEWRAMVVLASHPGAAAHEIAEYTGLDKMSISRSMAALVRHGRVDRAPDPADARRTLLSLSRTGRRLFEEIGELAAAREAQLFAGIGDPERARFDRTVNRLITALQDGAVVDQKPNKPG